MMEKISNVKPHKFNVLLTLFSAFIYLAIVSFQGFDLTDEGFCLSFYQQFFQNPTSVTYQFMFYLTGLFGGIWEVLFGWGGILSFRFFNALVIILTAFMTYKATEEYLQPIVFSLATFCVILLNNYGNIVFHHNYFSALLVAIAVLFLLKGFKRNKKSDYYFAGFFIGLSFFARIPNITMLSLGFLFLVNVYYSKDWKQFWKSLLLWVCGWGTAIILILCSMYVLGHFNIFINSIAENIFSLAIEDDSNHNLITMMTSYLYNYVQISRLLVIYFFLFAGFVFSFKLFKTKKIRVVLTVLMLLLLFGQLYHAYMSSKPGYYALILFPILISTFVDYRNKSIVLLNVASLIIMFLLPLGSDRGIENMGSNTIWLGSFTAFAHYYRMAKYKLQQKDYSIIVFLSIVIFSFLLINLYSVSSSAYFDLGSRAEKRYSMNNSLANVYTTHSKSMIMNELLLELDNYVVPGDTLLCFESLPTLQYLTRTVPFIGASWVWVYDSNSVKISLLRAEKTAAKMPVVLRQKTQPIGGKWTTFDIRYNDTVSEDNYLYKKERIIVYNAFLNKHKYKIVWENDLFQILLADQ